MHKKTVRIGGQYLKYKRVEIVGLEPTTSAM